MKSSGQVLLVILAVVFAVALALTVSLICLAAAPEDLLFGKTTEVIAEATVPTVAQEMALTEEPTRKKGELVYQSLGKGNCRVAGIGTCTDACIVIPEKNEIGERVTEIADCCFLKCDHLSAVQIPASVERIGNLAFADCPNLVYLSVSQDNEYYCDVGGVLYSKDLSHLLLYPPMRAGNIAEIPASVTEISEMAFYHCAFLKRITYAGSAETWEAIRIGNRNYTLSACAKVFSGSMN